MAKVFPMIMMFSLSFYFIAVIEWEGEVLNISKISRLDMGAYLCIASNGIPPSVSKRIKVSVDCKCTFTKTVTFFNLVLSCYFEKRSAN